MALSGKIHSVLENAPDFVKNHFNSYKEKLEIIKLTDEVTDLAKQYIDEKVISKFL